MDPWSTIDSSTVNGSVMGNSVALRESWREIRTGDFDGKMVEFSADFSSRETGGIEGSGGHNWDFHALNARNQPFRTLIKHTQFMGCFFFQPRK